MVARMFAILPMSCWGKKFIKLGTGSGLLGIVLWCAMSACNAAWERVAMAMA
jgi:hypothetical protein